MYDVYTRVLTRVTHDCDAEKRNKKYMSEEIYIYIKYKSKVYIKDWNC